MVFDNAQISGFVVRNRIFRSATHDGLADENGAPGEKLIRKYGFLAESGVGCIISGYAAVSRNGVSPYPKMLTIYNDKGLDNYRLLTDAVHKRGEKLFSSLPIAAVRHLQRQSGIKR